MLIVTSTVACKLYNFGQDARQELEHYTFLTEKQKMVLTAKVLEKSARSTFQSTVQFWKARDFGLSTSIKALTNLAILEDNSLYGGFSQEEKEYLWSELILCGIFESEYPDPKTFDTLPRETQLSLASFFKTQGSKEHLETLLYTPQVIQWLVSLELLKDSLTKNLEKYDPSFREQALIIFQKFCVCRLLLYFIDPPMATIFRHKTREEAKIEAMKEVLRIINGPNIENWDHIPKILRNLPFPFLCAATAKPIRTIRRVINSSLLSEQASAVTSTGNINPTFYEAKWISKKIWEDFESRFGLSSLLPTHQLRSRLPFNLWQIESKPSEEAQACIDKTFSQIMERILLIYRWTEEILQQTKLSEIKEILKKPEIAQWDHIPEILHHYSFPYRCAISNKPIRTLVLVKFDGKKIYYEEKALREKLSSNTPPPGWPTGLSFEETNFQFCRESQQIIDRMFAQNLELASSRFST